MSSAWSLRFLTSTRGRLITLLRRDTRTVDDLASALNLTDNAVRAHLAALERDGIVRQSGVRRDGGVGKPAFAYELTADAAPGIMCADVIGALADDLNTPKAIASLHELRTEAAKGNTGACGSLKASAQLIGLLQQTAVQWASFWPASVEIDENKVTALIAERNAARQAKNFRESDRLRDELAKMGVVVKDTKDGTTWEIAR